MQDYDATLKLLLKQSGQQIMKEFFGAPIVKWLDVELPRVQNLRVDMLGETPDGGLGQLELQSNNHVDMALRMGEYKLGIYRVCRKFPHQVVLYVGEAPMRMESQLRDDDVLLRYRLVDIRELDGDYLLESTGVGDNVIAILAKLRDHREAVRKIIARIMGLPPDDRRDAAGQLLILAGLRPRLVNLVRQETRHMPITIDPKAHPILGPMLQEERQEGRQEGWQEGRQEGELVILRRLIEKRFGRMPSWAELRLAARSAAELEDLSERVLDARSLEELLP